MSKLAPLPPEFYLHRPNIVAPKLLGKLLVRRLGNQTLTGRIVETEAYLGAADAAAHASSGRTRRNQVLFGPPGRAYIYFIYGMHYCLNVSCEPEGRAGCVLLRALEPLAGIAEMIRLRSLLRHPSQQAPPRSLTSGPGRLCQAMAITRQEDNATDLTSPESTLLIAEDGYQPGAVIATTRIGIRKAAAMPLRFFIAENRFVSAPLSRG